MHVLFLEPFDAGSHTYFLDTLTAGLEAEFGVRATVLRMPGRHWKWRMRGAVVWLREHHDAELRAAYDLVFCSSYLALAELVGFYPELGRVPRVLYFHENQLAYPQRVPDPNGRDLHFAFTQLTSALAASCCVFNSDYNRTSFLDGGVALLRRMPDARPTRWIEEIRGRSRVLGLPLDLGPVPRPEPRRAGGGGPVILWNHRWEHDKNPAELFGVLGEMAADGVPFRLLVCGQAFGDVPPEFALGRTRLAHRIEHWGFVADRAHYHALLRRADLAVSTAVHEFFGVAMLEATWAGARPLVPDRLVYPELFPPEFRYTDLRAALEPLCLEFASGARELRGDRERLVAGHRKEAVLPRYHALFTSLVEGAPLPSGG
ncbi:MAG: DUF3524 domain-containing protein [Planctomycetes bacterium]|nr:DUF3524 domain-containing protein [Planctomycetota bacterium]MCB9888619.1 DUF3524 domain-containing protein [Planctomycetota bacterium]